MRSEREMYSLILGYARKDPNIRGVVMNGSRADPQAALDHFRDYDIVFLATDITPLKQGDISGAFGEILVMQRTDESELFDEHLPNCAIYLMQFTDGTRIDLTVLPKEDYHGSCFGDRLSIVLLDKDGFLPQLPPPDRSSHFIKPPSISLFEECRTEFWWTAPYIAKALWRGQPLYAQEHLEICSRKMLRLMLGWLVGATNDFKISIGKCGDKLKTYLPADFWERYLLTYACCKEGSDGLGQLRDAFFTACSLFSDATARAAKALGFSYDSSLDRNVTDFLRDIYPAVAKMPPCDSWEREWKRQQEQIDPGKEPV